MQKYVYDDMYQLEETHWWFMATRAIILTTLTKLLKGIDNPVILDAGCGTGGTTRQLLTLGEVHGVDPSAEAIAYCQSRGLTNITQGYIEQLPYEDNTFDAILLADVLEHIKDDEQALRELSRVLKPQGHLVITVPAHPWMWTHHDTTHEHFRRYTKPAFVACITKAGLDIRTLTYYNMFLFPLVLIARWQKKLLRRTTPDTMPPARPINTTLAKVFSLEKYFVRRVPLPIGVSLFCVATKHH